MPTYATLLADIPLTMMNSESAFVAQCPTFAQIAQDRLFRDLIVPALETNTTGSLVAATATLSNPTRLIAYRYVMLQASNAWITLPQRTLAVARQLYPSLSASGTPAMWSVGTADNIVFTPAPSIANPYDIRYRQKLAYLTGTDTNWLTDNAYDALLYASCAEASRFVQDDRQGSMIKIYESQYAQAVSTINGRAVPAAQDDYTLPFGSSGRAA